VPIGLVRVYESTDTPHVSKNGRVVVRSVAEASNQARVCRPGGVDTQLVLRQLADRGRQALQDAESRLHSTPLIQSAIGMETRTGLLWSLRSNNVAVRAVPLVADRLSELAVSRTGRELLDSAARDLAGVDANAATMLRPAASGLVCEIESPSRLLDGVTPVPRTAVAAADAAGVIAVALRFHVQMPSQPPSISLENVRDAIIRPLLAAVVALLDGAELYGRSILELRIGDLSMVLMHGGGQPDPDVPWSLSADEPRRRGPRGRCAHRSMER
jgi:hypothetical protein